MVSTEAQQTSAVYERPAGILITGIWFALVTGLAEVSYFGFKKLFIGKVGTTQHIWWMAPLAEVLIFVSVALVILLVVRFWPRLSSVRNTTFVFALLGFFSLLFLFSFLHRLAALALSIGFAMQTARIVSKHSRGFELLVKRTTVWMMTIVVVLALVVFGWEALAERRALASLPPASPGVPNVLLITLDTVRAKNLSLYGYTRPTSPQLERLAQRGVVFERAVATASWTIPSHASMFTGRYLHELPEGWRAQADSDRFSLADDSFFTLAEALRTQGFMTAGFTANYDGCGYESGLVRGFAYYEDYPLSLGQLALGSTLVRVLAEKIRLHRRLGISKDLNSKNAEALNRDFLDWLSSAEPRPFFAFLNYFDAHGPYLPPKPFDEKFGARPRTLSIDKLLNQAARPAEKADSPKEIQAQVNAYDGSIAYLDYQLGVLFDELERLGVLENTLVIITSDHGEEFGDHGVFGHGHNLYWMSLHVPLVISFPSRVPAGQRVREPVSLRDIAATVVHLTKNEATIDFPGRTLARYWDGASGSDALTEDPPLSELSGHEDGDDAATKSLVFDHYHYIRRGGGREELYDTDIDPFEKQNIASSAEGAKKCELFRKFLEPVFAKQRVPH